MAILFGGKRGCRPLRATCVCVHLYDSVLLFESRRYSVSIPYNSREDLENLFDSKLNFPRLRKILNRVDASTPSRHASNLRRTLIDLSYDDILLLPSTYEVTIMYIIIIMSSFPSIRLRQMKIEWNSVRSGTKWKLFIITSRKRITFLK